MVTDMISMIILGIGIWVTAMFIVGYFFANKESVEDQRDYYDRHGQPKLDDKRIKVGSNRTIILTPF